MSSIHNKKILKPKSLIIMTFAIIVSSISSFFGLLYCFPGHLTEVGCFSLFLIVFNFVAIMKLLGILTQVRANSFSKIFWLLSVLSSTSILIFFSGICWNFELNQIDNFINSSKKKSNDILHQLDRYDEIKSEFLVLTEALLVDYLTDRDVENLTKAPFEYSARTVNTISYRQIQSSADQKMKIIKQRIQSCEISGFDPAKFSLWASDSTQFNVAKLYRPNISLLEDKLCKDFVELNNLVDCFKNNISIEEYPHEGYSSLWPKYVDWTENTEVLISTNSSSHCFTGIDFDALINEKDYKIYGLMLILFFAFLYPLFSVKQPVIKGNR